MMIKEKSVDNVYVLADDYYCASGVDEGFKFLVYQYDNYDTYSGSGDAYCMDSKGQLWYLNLSHCSCNCPFSDGGWTKVELSDLKTDSVHDLGSSESLENAVLELVEMYK